MLYRADAVDQSVTPLTEDLTIEFFNQLKALELRMARAEDLEFLRSVFTYFVTEEGKAPSGVRVLDILGFTTEEMLLQNIKGVSEFTLVTKIKELQQLYGVSTVPRRNPNDPVDLYFFADRLDAMISHSLREGPINRPAFFGYNLTQYLDILKGSDFNEYVPGDLQIAIIGSLTRFGMRYFKDSPDSKRHVFWAGFEKTSTDDKVLTDFDHENFMKLAALPSHLDSIGAKKLGMITYKQPKLL